MRKIALVLAFISMMSLGSCMAGPIMLGEAIDDMVVDVIPGDAPPEFNLPFFGNLHADDFSWTVLLPWNWFGEGEE